MAKDVSIIIKAIDQLTGPIREMSTRTKGFVDGLKGIFAGLTAGLAALGLIKFFKDSVAASLEAEKSVARLDSALRLVGTSYKNVEPEVEKYLTTLQRTTRYSDEDGREALTTLITATGNYRQSVADMTVVADLAAFKQISLSEAAVLVAKAHQGTGRELRLFGIQVKQGTDAVPQLAAKLQGFEANSRTLGDKLKILNNHWDEFKERIGNAILGTDSVGESVDKVSGFLIKMENWVTKNSEKITAFVEGAISLGKALGTLVSGAGARTSGFLTTLAKAWEMVSYVQQKATLLIVGGIARVIQMIGVMAQKANPLLKVFGVQLGDGMAEAGARMVGQAKADLDLLENNHRLKMADLVTIAKGGAAAVAAEVKPIVTTSGASLGTITKATKDAMAAAQTAIKLGLDGLVAHVKDSAAPRLIEATGGLESAIKKIGDGWVYVDGKWQAVKPGLDEVEPTLSHTAFKARDVADQFSAMARNMGLIDLADFATGIGSIADGIGRIALEGASAATTLGGIGAAAGGITSILTMMTAESASARSVRIALEKNRNALEESSRAIGDLITLNTPGAKLDKIQEALAQFTSTTGGGRGNIGNPIDFLSKSGTDALNTILASLGLTVGDLDALAKERNLTIRNSAGKLDFQLLQQLFQEIKNLEPTKFGADFRGQREQLRVGAELNNLTPAQQAAQLAALAGGSLGSSAIGKVLSGLDFSTAGGRGQGLAAIQGLFAALPGLSASDLGGLSGKDFLDALKDLKSLLESAGIEATPGGIGVNPDRPPIAAVVSAALPIITELTPITSGLDLLGSIDISTKGMWEIMQAMDATTTGTGLGAITVTVGDIIVQGAGGAGQSVAQEIAGQLVEAIDQQLALRYRLNALGQGSAAR